MPYARISGWGMYVPSKVVTNQNLVEAGLDSSDEWILTRTGVKERRLIGQNEATSDLAAKAAEQAMQVANVHPGDVDLVIVATCHTRSFPPRYRLARPGQAGCLSCRCYGS